MSKCDRYECPLRDELWLCSLVRRRKMEEASACGRCWAASYCLTWDLTHLGPSGTRQTNNTFPYTSASLSCLIGSIFSYLFIFKAQIILRWIPIVISRCHLRLTLPRAFCWLCGHVQPAGACSGLLHEATRTSWWSWVAAGRLGPGSSIDVWLFVLTDSPKRSTGDR